MANKRSRSGPVSEDDASSGLLSCVDGVLAPFLREPFGSSSQSITRCPACDTERGLWWETWDVFIFNTPEANLKNSYKIILFSYHHNKINCYELITCCTAHLNCVFFASDHHPQQSKFLPFSSLEHLDGSDTEYTYSATRDPPFEDFTPTQPISFKLPPHVCNRAQLHIVETRHVPRSVAVDLSTVPSSAFLTPFMMW